MNTTFNKFFKLVLGLGNCSYEEIEKLCSIYAQAGADIFDLSPSAKSVYSAKKGVQNAGLNPDDFKYCVSFGVKGDTHVKKAVVNEKKCVKCYKCIKKCPQNAIYRLKNGFAHIDSAKCIGCRKCEKSCIKFYDFETDIEKAAAELKSEKIDMVELHISSFNKKEIIENWEKILKSFKCKKSLCIARTKFGDEKLLKLVKKLIEMNSDKTIIQADGIPMSGEGDISSTLQAIAHAQLYQGLDVEIFISGGTNSHTRELADMFKLDYNGVTIGSYARAIVKNKDPEDALKAAVELIKSVKA